MREPFLWYLGIAVVLPLLNGARFGVHLFTTLAVACVFFLGVAIVRRVR
jgi:hypothetical protein